MNKNSKRILKLVRRAKKQGQPEVAIDVPVRNYHSENKFIRRTVPVPVIGKNGVVSRSPARNMQERVFQNKGAGSTQSLTAHEPINPSSPVKFKNHSYIEYRQPPSVT